MTRNRPIRLLNRDGELNVHKDTLSSTRVYNYILSISWQQFLFLALAFFTVVNVIFSILYYFFAGKDCLIAPPSVEGGSSIFKDLVEMFFFSTQTFTTVGYGHIYPHCYIGNIIASFESFTGWIFFSMVSGLFYTKFTRPQVKIKLSNVAVFDNFMDGVALKFMLANEYDNKLVDVEVTLDLIKLSVVEGRYKKRFYKLLLLRNKIPFLSVPWTVVHQIDNNSPLKGLTKEEFESSSMEFFVQVKVFDEAHSQTFFKEFSYFGTEEVLWGHKFVNIQRYTESGALKLSMKRFGRTKALEEFSLQL
jgi:inward rectifier potassium channel